MTSDTLELNDLIEEKRKLSVVSFRGIEKNVSKDSIFSCLISILLNSFFFK